jgi:hypothetical protein
MRVDPKPGTAIISLLWSALVVVVLGGCGSGAPPRAVDQRPVTEYKSWTISVTPSRMQDAWWARVRVWPPEVRPETHTGIDISFSGAAADRSAVEQAGTAAARRYIDASLPAHPQSSSVPNAAQIPADHPPVMSEYKGWTISVTPSRMQDAWWARVRVWPPEVRPEAHPGIGVSFNGTAAERSAVEQAATAAARRYIDSSVSTH